MGYLKKGQVQNIQIYPGAQQFYNISLDVNNEQIIQHNLRTAYPFIYAVVDDSGSNIGISPNFEIVDINTVKVKFDQVYTGRIVIQGGGIGEPQLPIGMIMAVHPDVNQNYLPDVNKWAFCGADGDKPTGWSGDVEGITLPVDKFNNGRNVPHLSDSRFLMGASGFERAGSNSSAHIHSVPAHYHGFGAGSGMEGDASTSSVLNHNHTLNGGGANSMSAAAAAYSSPQYLCGGNSSSYRFTPGSPIAGIDVANADLRSHTHPISGNVGLVTGGVDGNAGMTSGAASASDNKPQYFKVMYFIRTA